MKVKMMSNNTEHTIEKVGVFTPKVQDIDKISSGEIGFIITGIKNLSDTNESLYFLDVRPSMLLTSGKADPSLFVKDMLHMNKKGYEVWTRIVKTALIENL